MPTINWSIEELQKVIDEIVSGERLVEIESKAGPMFIVLRYPSRSEIRASEVKMSQTMHRAIKDNFLTEEQMMYHIQQRGIWTAEDDEKVEDFKEKIEKWREKLKPQDLTDKARSQITEAIELLEKKIFETEYKKEVMLINTAERKARQEKYEYLVWCCSYDPETNERIWNNYLTYCRLMDTEFKGKLLGELLRYLGGRKTEEVRYIARSNLWRISYVIAQKTNTPLFPRAVIDLTPDQTNLAWWSGYYDGIYQMMPEDQPDDRTIEDDEALDKYMEELHKERSRERQDARLNKRNTLGAKSARNMKTQLIMRENPDYMNLEYNKPPTHLHGDKTDSDVWAEAPNTSKAAKNRSKPIVGSRRFKKPDNGE